MIEGVIYRYKSPSGKYYIGQTTHERKRRWAFLNIDVPYSGDKINKARLKYGPENFEYSVLMKVTGDTKEEVCKYLNILEMGFIKMYDSIKNGYNLNDGGDRHTGYTLSEETKEKLRQANIGKHLNEEHKRKISESHKGKSPNEEVRKRISESLKGKHLNEENKRKISECHKGKSTHISEETKKKISESLKGNIPWNKGKQMSDEYRKKLSESHKGKTPGNKGKKCKSHSTSEETRKKISVANKGRSPYCKGKHRVYSPDGSYHFE